MHFLFFYFVLPQRFHVFTFQREFLQLVQKKKKQIRLDKIAPYTGDPKFNALRGSARAALRSPLQLTPLVIFFKCRNINMDNRFFYDDDSYLRIVFIPFDCGLVSEPLFKYNETTEQDKWSSRVCSHPPNS